MTLQDIQKRQQKELDDYMEERRKRCNQLHRDQSEVLEHCVFFGPKGSQIIDRIFKQQCDAWQEKEKDELDALIYAHAVEREYFAKQQQRKSIVASRQSIVASLKSSTKKERSRGRD